MPPQRKLVVYLGCGVGGFALLAAIFRDRLVESALLVFFACILADGLIEGELSYGLRSSKRSYQRKANPVAYWFIMALWCVLIAVMGAALLGVLPRRSTDPAASAPMRGTRP
jgi:hypothetical protein